MKRSSLRSGCDSRGWQPRRRCTRARRISAAAMLTMLAAPLSASTGGTPPPTPHVLVMGASTAVNNFIQIANADAMAPRFASQINAVAPNCGRVGACGDAQPGAHMYATCSNLPNGVTCAGPGANCPGDDHCCNPSAGFGLNGPLI